MSAWYYAHNGQKSGPVTSAEFQRLATERKIGPEDLVWAEGMDKWHSAHELEGVEWPSPPPPVPVAAQSQERSKNAPGAVASFVYSLLGIFICGPIFGSMAISESNKARKLIDSQPHLYTGGGFATAGMVIGILDIVGAVIVIIAAMADKA